MASVTRGGGVDRRPKQCVRACVSVCRRVVITYILDASLHLYVHVRGHISRDRVGGMSHTWIFLLFLPLCGAYLIQFILGVSSKKDRSSLFLVGILATIQNFNSVLPRFWTGPF